MSWGPAWHPGAQEIKEIYGRGLSDLEQFEIWAGTGDTRVGDWAISGRKRSKTEDGESKAQIISKIVIFGV